MLNLPVVLYGCETWYLTLKEEYRCRLRVFENGVNGRILDLRGREAGEDYITKSFIICTVHQILCS